MLEHDGALINFEWKKGSGPSFSSQNPATGEILWQGKAASSIEVDEAVQASQKAFDSWMMRPIENRAEYLLKFGELLRQSQQNLAEIISKETGKPLWDSLAEVEAMIKKVHISLDAYKNRCAEILHERPHVRSITRHKPHGVVAVLGPYNFPGHLPNGHIIPALLAGNTIVFKASEWTPLVAEETMRLWQKTGLPKGVLNLVQGGKETGQALIHHKGIQGLFFTGSYQTGQLLLESFGQEIPKILALEMGGNNPLIIGKIINLQAAAYAIIQSAYLSSGQRCTCARRLIIPNTNLGEDLLTDLIEMIGTISIGPYTQSPEPFMGPVISEKHAQELLAAQANLQSKGGKILIEMDPLQAGTGFISPGLMDVTSITDRPDEEIFGPFLQVIRAHDFQEAIKEANQTKYGLTAGLLSQSEDEFSLFYNQIKAGVVNWNTPLTGAASDAPFGGIKCSGNFHPSAYYAADYCAYPVASLESPDLKMPAFLTPGIAL